jgi:3'-5' exoribonuclease
MFQEGVASSGHHPMAHRVPGGLVLHTLEVARAAVEMSGADKVLAARAYVAAVFHDYGKIHEYTMRDGVSVKLPFAARVGHIVYGWRSFLDSALAYGLGYEETEEIAHALLAHHGRREFGSPVTPQTRLAMILHTADGMSARGLL